MSFENSKEIMEMTQQCAENMGMGPYYLYRQKNIAGNFENVGYAKVDKAGIYNILIMEEKQSIMQQVQVRLQNRTEEPVINSESNVSYTE